MAFGIMPAGVQAALDRKYGLLQQQANNETMQARARANLDNQTASVVRPEAMSRVGLNNANAFKTKEEGMMVRPMGEAEIRRIDEWIKASQQNTINQTNSTDANAGYIRSQAVGQNILNAAAPRNEAIRTAGEEIKLRYLEPGLRADIDATRAGADNTRSATDVNRNNIRNSNQVVPITGGDRTQQPAANGGGGGGWNEGRVLAPMPPALAPFQSNSALAALFGSRGQAAATPSYQASAPVQSALPGMLASYGGGGGLTGGGFADATASLAAPVVAPLVRRSTPSVVADSGPSLFMNPIRMALGRRLFDDNTMRLKRGTARVPGKGEGDVQPALLEPGEAILNKHAAGMMGRDKIAKLNKKGNELRSKENLSKVVQAIKMLGMA